MRYWPQIYPIHLDAQGVSESLEILVNVQGHVSMKNGLGQLNFAEIGEAHKMFVADLLVDVLAVLAMAAAITMAGFLGFFASRRDLPSERLLFMQSVLSVMAAMRMTAIFISDPPVSLALWSALSISLFIWISLWILAILATYLKPAATSIGTITGVCGAAITVIACTLPARFLNPFVNSILALLSLAGVVLLARVFVAAKQRKDITGWQVLTSFFIVITLLTHDLRVHFGPETIAGNYILLYTIPVLIVMITALLMRSLHSQHNLERALTTATERREDLLRDLHDGIGSRLVALSFSVRTPGTNVSIADEVDGLIHELQVIQKAVRAGNTDLQSLFSDLRHLYSKVGSGALPLRWQIEPDLPVYPLTPDQAIATVRILEEAIANAVKHAHPNSISIALTSAQGSHAATMSVSDDGIGDFRPATSGGLKNIGLRARRAGLSVQFDHANGLKQVLLYFPRVLQQRTFFQNILDKFSVRRLKNWVKFSAR